MKTLGLLCLILTSNLAIAGGVAIGNGEKHRRDLQLTYDIEELIEAEDNPDYVPKVQRDKIDEVAYDKIVAEHKAMREKEEAQAEKYRLEYIEERERLAEHRAKLNYVSREQYFKHIEEKKNYYATQRKYREEFIRLRDQKIIAKDVQRQKSLSQFVSAERDKSRLPASTPTPPSARPQN